MVDEMRSLELKYKTNIRRIINKNIHHFGIVNQSSYDEDTKQAFDFIYEFKNSKIPVRIRKHIYFKNFRDLTIRSKTAYGMRTEYDKLKDGFGDIYFYAWENKKNKSFVGYILVDLHQFRKSGLIDKHGASIPNGDGTEFYSFKLNDLIMNNCLKIYEEL